jgi:hypothetical protein
MSVYSDFAIPAFWQHVTIRMFHINYFSNPKDTLVIAIVVLTFTKLIRVLVTWLPKVVFRFACHNPRGIEPEKFGSNVLTAVAMKNYIFCDITPRQPTFHSSMLRPSSGSNSKKPA